MKNKRIENKELLKSYHEKSCVVCGSSPSDPHHIKTRGAGGNDTESNLIALCRNHHIELHKIGQKTFFKKYHLLFNNID